MDTCLQYLQQFPLLMHYNPETPYCIRRAPIVLKFSSREADTQMEPKGGAYAKTNQIIWNQDAYRNLRLD